MSLTMLLLCFLQSIMVLNFPVFFGMHSISAACSTLAMIHHFAFM